MSHFWLLFLGRAGRCRCLQSGQNVFSFDSERLLHFLLVQVCHLSCRVLRLEQFRQWSLAIGAAGGSVGVGEAFLAASTEEPARAQALRFARELLLACDASEGVVRHGSHGRREVLGRLSFAADGAIQLGRTERAAAASWARGKAFSILVKWQRLQATLFARVAVALMLRFSGPLMLMEPRWHARH